jgi:very-short-patch-repair endonuclease
VVAAADFQEAYSWISRAVSREFTTTSMLRAALASRRRIRWRSKLAVALGDSDEGIHFGLERLYARDVERAHGLPRAQRQARREIAGRAHYRDNWYAEYRLCVELDGPSFHRDEQVRQDKRRDNLNLAADGVQTFRFGPVEVTELACESAVLVATAMRRNGWKGTPHPCRRAACPMRQRKTAVS